MWSCLIVDDDPVSRAVLAAQVRRCGPVVHEAADGAAAVEALETEATDLVIADLRLPDGPGYRLAALTDAPVVLISGAVGPEDRAAARRAGCVAVLQKPVRLGDLRRTLSRLGMVHDDS